MCRYRQASNRDPPILYRHKSPSSVPGRPDRARTLNLPMPEASYRFRQQITIGLEIRDSSSTRTRSGAASSCRNTDRAASSSICALSSSPSARQASPRRVVWRVPRPNPPPRDGTPRARPGRRPRPTGPTRSHATREPIEMAYSTRPRSWTAPRQRRVLRRRRRRREQPRRRGPAAWTASRRPQPR